MKRRRESVCIGYFFQGWMFGVFLLNTEGVEIVSVRREGSGVGLDIGMFMDIKWLESVKF